MARVVREREEAWGPFIAYVQPEWRAEFSWLVQGMTGRAATPEAARVASAEGELERALCAATDLGRLARACQVHGAEVLRVGEDGAGPGAARPSADALLTDATRVGLAVFVADCVPVFAVDPVRRAAAVVHAGWRGTAAGVLEAAIDGLADAFGARPRDLHLHFGPAIGGECYEVGPEVFEALGLAVPDGEARVDLAEVLEARAAARGVPARRMTRSPYCTRCHRDRFYSYRGEGPRAGRMAAVIGLVGPGRR